MMILPLEAKSVGKWRTQKKWEGVIRGLQINWKELKMIVASTW